MKTKYLFLIGVLLLTALTSRSQVDTLTASQNPFPISTDLIIHNLTNDTITFKVYNQYGNIVADFFETTILSGTITVNFNADTLPNGNYFVRLTKNSESHILKIGKYQTTTNLISDEKDLHIIQMYPNPTSNFLTISTEIKITELELYDSSGKLLKSEIGHPKTIDLQNFDNGFYLLHLKSNSGTYIEKILKK